MNREFVYTEIRMPILVSRTMLFTENKQLECFSGLQDIHFFCLPLSRTCETNGNTYITVNTCSAYLKE